MFSSRFALLAVVSAIAAAVAVAQKGDDECVKGVAPLAGGTDFSEWPAMYRLTSPDPEDPREPNFADDVDPSVLAYAGVTYRYIDPTGFDYPNATAEIPWVPTPLEEGGNNDPYIEEIRGDNDYQYADIIVVTDFIPTFWDEHLHEATTIRYMLDGSGYFDLRDVDDNWVRIPVSAGDWFEWPSGIEHRFTVDNEESYIQAMRLYKGSASPEWSAVPRSQVVGNNTARNEYVDTYMCGDDPDYEIVAIVAPVEEEEESATGAPSDAPKDGGEEESMTSTSAPSAAVIEGDSSSSSGSGAPTDAQNDMATTGAPAATQDDMATTTAPSAADNMMEDDDSAGVAVVAHGLGLAVLGGAATFLITMF